MNDDQPPLGNIKRFFQSITGLFYRQNSKEDLKEYLQEAQDNNIIDTEEAAMMAGVLAVSEQRVRDVMLPKSKMVILPYEMSFDETIKVVLNSGHSRFPIERDEEIVGILLAKDLLGYINSSENEFSIERSMRSVRHIPESKPLDMLLREFRHQRLHMVIVTNEYGEVAGLVTIEDVLEEIVGEIDDEHDNEVNNDITKIDNQHYLVSASTEIEDFNAFFKTELDKETHDTIGGFVLSHFGYVPTINEKAEFSGLNFTIKEANDRRILTLLIER
ncbi:MAG: HlyC/CorC family transporter [Ostreibacterium sp.]